jgi:hypothetical protein
VRNSASALDELDAFLCPFEYVVEEIPGRGIVREIFERFAHGSSCRTIAQELNDRGVPSPGSTWKRKVRRCTGWTGSAVRVILKNP